MQTMHVLATAISFAPTNNEPFLPLWVLPTILGLVALLLALATIFKSYKTVVATVAVILVGLVLSMVAVINDAYTDHKNKENLKSNLEMVYEFDEVSISRLTLKDLRDGETTKVTVTRGDESYELNLSQDSETFEPKLSQLDAPEDIDEWLSKK